MNKKFSTFLMACMFLLGTISAYAQTAVPKLVKGDNEGLYQLRVGSGAGTAADNRVLALDNDGIIKAVDVTPGSTELTTLGINLSHTLWCVHVTQVAQGVPPTYEFLNKATGQYLSVTMQGLGSTTTNLGVVLNSNQVESNGEIYNWSFSEVYATNNSLEPEILTSFYADDYVIGFVVDPSTYHVGVKKMYKTSVNPGDYTIFTLQEARTIVLSKEDFNSILAYQDDEDGVELVFDPKITNNPFLCQGNIFAEQSDMSGFLYIRDEDNNYLMVDTAYINTIGTDYLGYKWVDLSEKQNPVTFLNNSEPFAGQYKFRFTYSPSINDLKIEVRESSYKLDNRPNWISWINGAKVNTYTIEYDRFIRVQDYGNEGYNLTVSARDASSSADLTQNVKVGFVDFEGCTVVNDKTSLPTDLYLITDGKGKYLAVNIDQTLFNENPATTNANTREAKWITIERNVNPWTMPALQWVVQKTQTASTLQATSPISIRNREYGNVIVKSNFQLYVDSEKELFDGVKVTPENFIRDTEGVKANPYVGYRNFDKDSLLIAGYTFKYLHEAVSEDLYLGIGGQESDSVIYAGKKVVFALDTVPTQYLGTGNNSLTNVEDTIFGYTPTRTVNGEVVPLAGWSYLERRLYTIKVKGTAEPTYVVLDDEDRYAVTKFTDWRKNATQKTPVRFYLKANNEKDGEVYYTLVDYSTNANANNNPFQTPKGGVNDNSLILSSNKLNEARTSAFAIEIDDTPLYRRFAHDPAEGAYANGDGPDTMRFYEKYRREYLQMETNPSFTNDTIDFLGIESFSYNPAEGKSFIVDSAWIGRGLGYIKPQYLISIDRNDQPAVDAIPCPEEYHGSGPDGPYDQWTCPHATKAIPGFNRGRYLINFEFPGYGVKDDAENDYVWRKFYRAGFVDAVHMGDSLFILRDEFEGLPNNRIDTAAIKAAEAAWRKADKDRTADDYYYIVNLQGDIHKFVTWSMRYVDPNHTTTNNEFLIESMSETGTITDAIAPLKGAWLKMNNGCLVLSDRDESEFNTETAGDDALIFNVEYVDGDELATDDEVIAESSVVVIAGQGNVTVKNAAGKKVSISNILGQTVANTVVTSDNATIAVPAGVVVVAVEGEAAVKAIVK